MATNDRGSSTTPPNGEDTLKTELIADLERRRFPTAADIFYGGKVYTPHQMIAEVRADTEVGQQWVRQFGHLKDHLKARGETLPI